MATNPLSAAAGDAAGGLRQQDFLRLMLQQLLVQDPLKPMDNTAFVAQMAQFSALAQTQSLNENMLQLLTLQSHNQAIVLMGKKVTFNHPSTGESTEGTVRSITMQEGIPMLSILVAGQTVTGVSMGRILGIALP